MNEDFNHTEIENPKGLFSWEELVSSENDGGYVSLFRTESDRNRPLGLSWSDFSKVIVQLKNGRSNNFIYQKTGVYTNKVAEVREFLEQKLGAIYFRKKPGPKIKRIKYVRVSLIKSRFSMAKRLLFHGFSDRRISNIAKVGWKTIRRIRFEEEKILGRRFLCACGDPANHQGFCKMRQKYIKPLKNGLGKNWTVTSPDGITTNVLSLNKFCRDNGVKFSALHYAAREGIKTKTGWSAILLD